MDPWSRGAYIKVRRNYFYFIFFEKKKQSRAWEKMLEKITEKENEKIEERTEQ